MKVIIFSLLALVIYTQAIGDDELVQKWSKFQVDFGKSYRSSIEARERFNIFRRNMEEIDSHNSIYENGLVSYKKGITQFADWTKDEFKQFVNKGLIKEQSRIGSKTFEADDASELPQSVDWRQEGIVTPVKDQGQCESCWAFSAVGALEGQLGLKGNITPLSEQNLIDCSWNQGNLGCAGGLMNEAFDYVKDNGIQSESDYPYLEVDNDCKADPSKIVTKIKDYVQIKKGNEYDLQNAIASKGPVSVAIDASVELQLYSHGVLVDPTCNIYQLNHGILAVGYGSEKGQDYYIIKNSWGESWGEDGYVRFARNHNNMCGISSLASYPEI